MVAADRTASRVAQESRLAGRARFRVSRVVRWVAAGAPGAQSGGTGGASDRARRPPLIFLFLLLLLLLIPRWVGTCCIARGFLQRRDFSSHPGWGIGAVRGGKRNWWLQPGTLPPCPAGGRWARWEPRRAGLCDGVGVPHGSQPARSLTGSGPAAVRAPRRLTEERLAGGGREGIREGRGGGGWDPPNGRPLAVGTPQRSARGVARRRVASLEAQRRGPSWGLFRRCRWRSLRREKAGAAAARVYNPLPFPPPVPKGYWFFYVVRQNPDSVYFFGGKPAFESQASCGRCRGRSCAESSLNSGVGWESTLSRLTFQVAPSCCDLCMAKTKTERFNRAALEVLPAVQGQCHGWNGAFSLVSEGGGKLPLLGRQRLAAGKATAFIGHPTLGRLGRRA